MSAGAQVWVGRESGARSATELRATSSTAAPTSPGSEAITALVRRLFVSGARLERRRVLFAAADSETDVLGLGIEIADILGHMQMTVALVESQTGAPSVLPKKQPASVRDGDFWAEFRVSENVWRIPASSLQMLSGAGNNFEALPFDCVVLTSGIQDSFMPWFCGICDAAVLVLTAERTRRDVALRAKEMLDQLQVQIVGTVLEGRRFRIPEAIYRRL